MAPPTRTWKSSERGMAMRLGGRRVPVTGRQRGDVPDIEHPQFAIEHKYGKVISARTQTALDQADAAAARTGKIPIVTFEHVTAGVTNPNLLGVTMTLEVFKYIAEKAGYDLKEQSYLEATDLEIKDWKERTTGS